MSFICGSFHHVREEEEEDDFDVLWGAAANSNSSSRSSCKVAKKMNSFCRKNKGSKNPYADRGLDKFSKLLADLDNKKQKIFTQKGSEDISFVRFVYTPNSKDATPIVVKGKSEKKLAGPKIVNATKVTHKSRLDRQSAALIPSNKSTTHVINVGRDQTVQPSTVELAQKSDHHHDHKASNYKKVANYYSSTTWEFMKLETWKRPSYYLPLFLVLILIFLAAFGRSFAILCTSIGWYVIPSINGSSESSKPSTKSNSKGPKRMKKEYARKISERVSSPRSVLNGPMSDGDGTRRRSF